MFSVQERCLRQAKFNLFPYNKIQQQKINRMRGDAIEGQWSPPYGN